MNQRASGILMPVSSLPGPYGIGCFSQQARAFVDWLAEAGQTFWQILPLGPTSYGDSPYQSFSTFAGNPYLIDLQTLVGEGLLDAADCEAADFGDDPASVDYGKLYQNRQPLLQRAFARWQAAGGDAQPAYRDFLARNAAWLEDYALFTAIKTAQGGAAWDSWPDPLRLRRPEALASARQELAGEMDYQRFVQYKFEEQWKALKAYANARGIRIVGDIPIYVAFDSADTWASPELFQLDGERRRRNTFPAQAVRKGESAAFYLEERETVLTRFVDPMPFVPADTAARDGRCEDILSLQAAGLRKRIEHAHAKTCVVGLSGGLDSTLALLVTVRAMDSLGRDRKDILAVTMPCFGTTSRTKDNATQMAELLGVSFLTVPIGAAVEQHFKDIGLPEDDRSVTYENGQARERTQVLMDLANRQGGMVIGTGDLSELALGWATYNGDHMSMYGVNGSVPKTLVRHIVRYVADHSDKDLAAVLLDILDTPVSPELLPPEDGEIAQKTEDLVGPYELHDFFLYQIVRFAFPPAKVYRLARYAWQGRYDDETILKWLKTFYRRFFQQQFKRSCLPDGPKVGSVSLSPRGDWRMPSDACATLWLNELENL